MRPQKPQAASSFLCCFSGGVSKKSFCFLTRHHCCFFLVCGNWFSIAWRLTVKVIEVEHQRHIVCALIPYLLPSWIFAVDHQMFTITAPYHKKRCTARAVQRRFVLNSLFFFKVRLTSHAHYFSTSNSLPILIKALMHLSSCSRVCAAES